MTDLSQSDSYAYIRDTYGVEPVIGERVSIDGALGTILTPDPTLQHYLRVRFDDDEVGVAMAHPTWRVDYYPEEAMSS